MKIYPIYTFDSNLVIKKESRFFRYYKDLNLIERFKICLVECYLDFINYSLLFISRLVFKSFKDENFKNILIYRTGSMGDIVAALSAIKKIRVLYPNAKLTVLTAAEKKGYVTFDLVAGRNLYDAIIDYTGRNIFSFSPAIKKNFDLIIELPQPSISLFKNLKNIFYFRFVCQIKHGFGWQVSVPFFFNKSIERSVLYKTESAILNQIIDRNCPNKIKEEIELNITPSDKIKVENLIKNNNIKAPFNIIIIGSNDLKNRWSFKNFLEISKSEFLNHGLQTLIVGGEADKDILEGYVLPEYVLNMCGSTNIGQSAYLISLANCIYTNDTGSMHLANAVGTRINAFFSCKDFPGRWFPSLDKATVFRSQNIPCSICLTNKQCENNFCLEHISATIVLNKFND